MSLKQSYKTLQDYRSAPLDFVKKMMMTNGHRTHLNIFGKDLFIVSAPEDVIHVLKTNNQSYTKGRTTKALRQFLGNGLITNEGDSWRKQHRLIRPMMNTKSIMEISPRILDTAKEFASTMNVDQEVNAFKEMNRLTWRIILKSLFSEETSPEMDAWLDDILELMHIITRKTRSSIPIPFWMPTKDHRVLKNIIKKFDQHVFGLIHDRRTKGSKDDLLQLLIDAQESGESPMTDREIRDEIMTFMMAGHETITNSMTWTLMEIAQNASYKKVLLDEANSFFENEDLEALNQMPWLTAVVDEVLRLWPPVWVFMRQAEKVDKLGDMNIPIKANVVLAPFNTHRSSDFWENPNSFYPERFLGEAKKKIIPGSFYPFGLGPRACIGAYFAGMEAKIILATMIKNFEWEILNPTKQEYDPGISLRPTNNILMKFRRRA